jgi:protein NUD1
MNPCTLGWYLPLLVHDLSSALQPSDGNNATDSSGKQRGDNNSWAELDAKFRRDLPDGAYAARLAYRGLIMLACPKIKMLDGVPVTAKERDKAERLLAGVRGARKALMQTGPGEGLVS